VRIPWLTILDILWRYGTVTALLVYVICRIGICLVASEEPALQVPPPCYEVSTIKTRLSWSAGEGYDLYKVQLFENGNFDNPVFTTSTRNTSVMISKLEEGRSYCWRVLDDEDARVSCFKTADHMVQF
jgi:hypothetical protein